MPLHAVVDKPSVFRGRAGPKHCQRIGVTSVNKGKALSKLRPVRNYHHILHLRT